MRSIFVLAIAAAGLALPAFADDYTAKDLLSPCQESDNDARWGEAAETECEQYILGYIAALKTTGNAGEGTKICPPEQNTADEARWAFMRWVHTDFSKNKELPASDALMMALTENFPCGG